MPARVLEGTLSYKSGVQAIYRFMNSGWRWIGTLERELPAITRLRIIDTRLITFITKSLRAVPSSKTSGVRLATC